MMLQSPMTGCRCSNTWAIAPMHKHVFSNNNTRVNVRCVGRWHDGESVYMRTQLLHPLLAGLHRAHVLTAAERCCC